MDPMNCEDTIERLPWLLNGSLEPEERAALLLHLQGCERCRQALGETRLAFDIFSRHLSPAQLVALAADEVPDGPDLDMLQRHLESCAQCAADLELARMSRQLVAEDKVALLPAARRQKSRASWWPAALAAGLTAMVMGGGWLATSQKAGRLSHQLAEQKEEQGAIAANAQLVMLSPPAAVRGGAGAPEKVLPAGVPITVSIVPGREPLPERLGIRIFDAGDELVLASSELLERQASGDYRLHLDRDALPPGAYKVRTYVVDGNDWVPFEEYPIRVGP